MQVLPTIPKKDQRSRVKPKQDVLYRVGVVEGGRGGGGGDSKGRTSKELDRNLGG